MMGYHELKFFIILEILFIIIENRSVTIKASKHENFKDMPIAVILLVSGYA